jgi:hypothetical protein
VFVVARSERTAGAAPAALEQQDSATVAGRLARISDDPFAVPRIEIERADTLPRFLRKLWFGAAP